MSKTIDEKVVSMRFDNQQFERGVKQTQNSVQDLKKSLNFEDSGKGISKLQGFINTFSLMHMDHGIQDVSKSFTTMGTIAHTVLERITNSAMDTARNMANSLGIGIGGIKDGFSEYELEMNSVQTMLANMQTQSDDTADSVGGLTGNLKEMVESVWRGDYGNGQDRKNVLGQIYQTIQDQVNVTAVSVAQNGKNIKQAIDSIQDTTVSAGSNIGKSIDQAAQAAGNSVDKNLDKVESALGELNLYADKTVYSFSDMTSAIGQFMTAGVDLKTSTEDIQGLSNIGAAFGVDNMRLKSTFYQLSQAISAGKIQLMDWRSIINANMSGPLFKNEIIRTAEEMGAFAKAGTTATKVQQDFNGSLQDGWFTADVLNASIAKFTASGLADYLTKMTDLSGDSATAMSSMLKTMLDEGKPSAEVIKTINETLATSNGTLKISTDEVGRLVSQMETAQDAATKVKTFSQLIDTTREAIGTGWSDSFKIVIGNFNEAKSLWTAVNDKISPIISNIAKSRNDTLIAWKQAGGREAAINSISNAFKALLSVMKPINEAFFEVFKPYTGDTLAEFTKKIEVWTQGLERNVKQQEKIKEVAKMVFELLKASIPLVTMKFKLQLEIVKVLMPIITGLANGFAKLAEGLNKVGHSKDATSTMDNLSVSFDKFKMAFGGFTDKVKNSKFVALIAKGIESAFTKLGNTLTNLKFPTWDGEIGWLNKLRVNLVGVQKSINQFKQFKGLDSISGAAVGIDKFATSVDNGSVKLFNANALLSKTTPPDTKPVNKFRQVMHGLGGVLVSIASIVSGTFKDAILWCKKNLDWDKVFHLAELATVYKLLQTMDQFEGFASGFENMGKGVQKFLTNFGKGVKSYLKGRAFEEAGKGLMFMAGAVAILAGSLIALSMVKPENLVKGAIAIGAIIAGLVVLTKAVKSMSEAMSSNAFTSKNMLSITVVLIGIGLAMKEVAKAIKIIASSNPENLSAAIVAITITLGEMIGAMYILAHTQNSVEMTKSLGAFIAMAAGLKMMGEAVKTFGDMDIKTVYTGLLRAGIALAMLTKATKAINSSAYMSISSAGTIIAMTMSLMMMAHVIKQYAKIDFITFYKGLIRASIGMFALAKGMQAVSLSLRGASQGFGKDVMLSMVAMSIALLSLAHTLKIMNDLNIVHMAASVAAISALIWEITLSIKSMTATKEDSKEASSAMKGMAYVLGTIGIVVAALGLLNPKQALQGVASVSAILIALGASMKLMGGYQDAKAPLKTMAFVVGELSGMIMLLSLLPVSETLIITGSLSALMLSLGASMKLLSGVKVEAGSIKMVALMSLILGALSGVLILLSKFGNSKDYVPIAEGISILVVALCGMTAAVAGISKLKTNETDILSVVSVLGLMTGVVAVVGLVIAGISKLGDAKSYIPVATSMAILMTAMLPLVVACGVIAYLMKGESLYIIEAAAAVLGAMVVLIGGMYGFLEALGWLSTAIKDKGGKRLQQGLDIVDMLLSGMAKIFEHVMNIVVEGISKQLVTFGKSIESFWDYMEPFLKGVNKIDKGTLKGVKNLVSIMVSLSGANLKSSIANFASSVITGSKGDPFSAIGKGMASFGKAIKKFDKNTEGINLERFAAVSKGLGNLSGFINTINDLAGYNFSTLELTGLGMAEFLDLGIQPMISALNKITDAEVAEVAVASPRIELIGKMASSLGTFGDLIPDTTSLKTEDWSTFGTELESFISSLETMVTSLTSDSTVTSDTYKQASANLNEIGNFVDPLTRFVAIIPQKKSLKTIISGTTEDWDTFGTELQSFISSLEIIGLILTSNSNVTSDTYKQASANLNEIGNFVDPLTRFVAIIPQKKSLKTIISGTTEDWDTFGTGLSSFVGSLVKIVGKLTSAKDKDGKEISGLTDAKVKEAGDKLTSIGGFTTQLSNFAKLKSENFSFKGMWKGTHENWKEFGKELTSFTTSMLDIVTSLTDAHKNSKGKQVGSVSQEQFADAATKMGTFGTLAEPLTKLSAVMTVVGSVKDKTVGYGSCETWEDFGDELASFATSVADIANNATDLDPQGIINLNNALGGFTNLADFAKTDSTNLTKIGDAINALGVDIGSFMENTKPDKDSPDAGTSTTAINEMVTSLLTNIGNHDGDFHSTGESLARNLINGFKNGKKDDKTSTADELATTATSIITRACKAINKSDAFDTMRSAGVRLASNLKNGLKNGQAGDGKSNYDNMHTIGAHLSNGFIKGVLSKLKEAANAGDKLATTTKIALQKALEIKSPSRVMYKLGVYTVGGYLKALSEDSVFSDIRQKTKAIASAVVNGIGATQQGTSLLADALSQMLNSNLEVNPVVKPILDLSNFQNGSNSIRSLLDTSVTASMVGSLSTSDGVGSTSLMDAVSNDNHSVTQNINVTVNGAENPNEWGEKFVKTIKREARMNA